MLSNNSFLFAEDLPDGDDVYPAIGETVERVAYKSNFDSCKAEAFRIMIKNCESYYVYHLVPTRGCYVSYCFGML